MSSVLRLHVICVMWYDLRVVAVYCIRNRVNGKVYIGQTKRPIEKRTKEHVAASLVEGAGFAIHAAMRKHGRDSFDVVSLEEDLSHAEASIRESWWITFTRSYVGFEHACGYNLTRGGEGSVGHVVSPETCRRISLRKKGIPMPIEQRERLKKAVVCIDVMTGEAARFESVSEAIRVTGVTNVTRACRGQLKTAGGREWRYIDASDATKGSWSDEKRDRMSERVMLKRSLDEPVEQLDLVTGRVIARYASQREARAAVPTAHNISMVCLGKRVSAGGSGWRYADETRHPRQTAVEQLDAVTGRVIAVFASMKEAGQHAGIHLAQVSAVCRGRRKSAGGFSWRYAAGDDETA